MSSQESGSTSPGDQGQLADAVTAFSDAVFEATQGLLSAQQQLTRTLLGGREGQTEADVEQETPPSDGKQETDPVPVDQAGQVDIDDEVGEGDELDDEAGEGDELDDEAGEGDELDDEAGEGDELDDEADQADAAEDEAPRNADPAPAGQRGRRPARRR